MSDLKTAIIQKVTLSHKRLRPGEVTDDLSIRLGVSPKDIKRAMNELVLEGRLEFTYYGQSFVELPLMMSQIGGRRRMQDTAH